MAVNKGPSSDVGRRDLLKGVAAASLATGLGTLARDAGSNEPPVPITKIEGYAGHLSYRPGDELRLHISTSATLYGLEIARVGLRREVVLLREGLTGALHAAPDNASTHGCHWPVSFTMPIPDDWRSGYYSVRLFTNEASGDAAGELYFVVRAARPGHNAKILLVLSTNTYNAYNRWGGTSLYSGPKGQGSQVSFLRPYSGFEPGDQFTSAYSGFRRWEQPFVEWAEEAGYILDFAVNSDLEFHPEILDDYRLVLSVGHDEYWSSPMRDRLEEFITAGGNVAFFSGNAVFWQVRSEDEGQTLVSWKQQYQKDPVFAGADHRLLSTLWCSRRVGRPENQLTGVSFAYGGYHRFFDEFKDASGGYTVHRPEHWALAGTGLARGDTLGAQHKVVGYECDGCRFTLVDGLPVPTHEDGTPEGFEILASAPAALSKRDNSIGWVTDALFGENSGRQHVQPGAAVLGSYTRGGTVFTTGCTDWAFGLRGRDPQVVQITRNVLDRLSAPVG